MSGTLTTLVGICLSGAAKAAREFGEQGLATQLGIYARAPGMLSAAAASARASANG